MKQCRICTADIEELLYATKDDPTVCNRCHMMMYGRYGHVGYAVHGCADGPGSCVNEMVFDRPDPAKDIALTLKRMEQDGKLNNPELRAAAASKLEEAKNSVHEKVDYGKDGHPLDA
jgi:hypothetical protein